MKRILTIEANKLFFYKTFWFFIGMHGCLFFLMTLIMDNVEMSIRKNITVMSNTHLMDFPVVWQSLSWAGGWLYYLLGILVIMLVTNDFECRTIRQNIIDGMSRVQYTVGRLLIICCFGAYACLMFVLLAAVFGNSATSGGPVSSVNAADFVFGFFIQGLGYMIFAMLAAVFCKRAAIAVVIFLVWPIIAEPILGLILDKNLPVEISAWLPLHAISEIIPAPKSLTAEQLSPIPGSSVCAALIYIVVMAFCAGLKIKIDDL